jgi:hypothetical protein
VAGQVLEGGIAIASTAVVEDLNLLDVIRAERIVARLSIWIPKGGTGLKVSTAGSSFEGLRLGGRHRTPWFNEQLHALENHPKYDAKNPPKDPPTGHPPGATRADAERIGAQQAPRVNETFKGRHNETWVQSRSKWMNGAGKHGAGCSLVDGFEDSKGCGHVVDIPGFGRIFLAELFITPDSAQLVGLRAELGCPVKGKITICCGGGGGVHD